MKRYCKNLFLVAGALLPLGAEPVPPRQADQGQGLGLNLAAPLAPPAGRLDEPLEEKRPKAGRLAPQGPGDGPGTVESEPIPTELAFDDGDCVAINPLAAAAGRFQPMIQEQEAGLIPSDPFVAMAPKLAELNRLCYFRGGMQIGEAGANGHWTLPGMEGWTLRNFNGARGLWQLGTDQNAGVVGYHPAENAIVICFHGGSTVGDWLENLRAWAEPVDTVAEPAEASLDKATLAALQVDPIAQVMVGKVHHGFLRRALSCRMQINAHVKDLLGRLNPEQKAQVKFYVTGHQHGAALGQVAIAWLCKDLRQHYGPDFSNARHNRVHGWFLAAPPALDPTAAAFIDGSVGKRNMLVQEATYDLAVHGPGPLASGPFKSAGTLAVQSSWDTFTRSLQHYRNRLSRHWSAGEYRALLASLVPANPFRASAGSAHGMSTSAGSQNFVLDADMILEVQSDITWALQNARNREQEELRRKAQPRTWGQTFGSWFGL